MAVRDPGTADQHRRAPSSVSRASLLDGCAACRLKRRFQDQVLLRVAVKNNSGHVRSAPSARRRAGRSRFGFIARDIARPSVQLGQCDQKRSSWGDGGLARGNTAIASVRSRPMRSAMANSQNKPAMTSADYRRREPISLDRGDPADHGRGLSGRRASRDRGVEQFATSTRTTDKPRPKLDRLIVVVPISPASGSDRASAAISSRMPAPIG